MSLEKGSFLLFLNLLSHTLSHEIYQVRHDLIGWLYKASPRGVMGLVRGWKRRYFVLLGNDLCYFVSRLKELKGSINLRDVQRLEFSTLPSEKSKDNLGPGNIEPFHVVTRDRMYTLCSQSVSSNRRWIRAIAHVARLVRTDRGLYLKSGLPIPIISSLKKRHWHRREVCVKYKRLERGRKYKSSREKIKLYRLRFSSEYHRWSLAIRCEDFEYFHDVATELAKTASLIVDSRGGQSNWNLARDIDDIRVDFSKRRRKEALRDNPKRFGTFVAQFTERILRMNMFSRGVWDELLESWLLNGRVTDISDSRKIINKGDDDGSDMRKNKLVEREDEEEIMTTFWESTLDDLDADNGVTAFDFGRVGEWYKPKKKVDLRKKKKNYIKKIVPLKSDSYVLEAMTSFWDCRRSMKKKKDLPFLSRGETVWDMHLVHTDIRT